ncbi:MAG: hypothetical protein CMF22_12145 [Idiomarinaceae bacterium]|nr:hypothetical protein [Idiomarinaceae bacterium]|tara:strand:+ start:156758 stop:157228 length:471 start_codon:yes stop_codon:yes gene_type:complete
MSDMKIINVRAADVKAGDWIDRGFDGYAEVLEVEQNQRHTATTLTLRTKRGEVRTSIVNGRAVGLCVPESVIDQVARYSNFGWIFGGGVSIVADRDQLDNMWMAVTERSRQLDTAPCGKCEDCQSATNWIASAFLEYGGCKVVAYNMGAIRHTANV